MSLQLTFQSICSAVLDGSQLDTLYLLVDSAGCIRSIPLNAGFNPKNVQLVGKFYLINPREGLIEKITYDQAERLVHKPPFDINFFMDEENLSLQVKSTLIKGVAHNIFSASFREDFSDWDHWVAIFATQRNQIMEAFMVKALSVRSMCMA